MNKTEKLKSELLTFARLGSALGLLGWDQEVNLPPKAAQYRGEVTSQLAADLHKKVTSKKFIDSLKELKQPENFQNLSKDDQVIVRQTWRDVEKASKLPTEFVEEMSKLTSQAFGVWAEARQKSDFKIFQPILEKIVAMNQKEAEFLGFAKSPYDALLDQYEPGLTTEKIEHLFSPLTKSLRQLIQQAAQKKPASLPKMKYDIEVQKKLNNKIAAALGYDLQAGRIDVSPHPFTIDFHPSDVRITTRYDEHDFWVALGSTVHETGHALYQQGLPANQFGTPLGEPVSLGIHESQSRIWENFVGKSRPFVDFLYPQLEKSFGQLPYSADELHSWLNRVQPNPIRVESDEVTYNLHIALRFEMERDLIEGNMKVADVPHIWNQKMKEYLGLDIKDDANGCLQDIHWSHGTFGYFPTYTLGNLYAAQMYQKIKKDILNLEASFAKGDFSQFLNWLRREIHVHGRRYEPEALLEKATGEPLNPNYLIDHLRTKVALS
ncbi:MAG: carboxypeptidase M32 [Segetibacter sp.]